MQLGTFNFANIMRRIKIPIIIPPPHPPPQFTKKGPPLLCNFHGRGRRATIHNKIPHEIKILQLPQFRNKLKKLLEENA